MVESAWRILLLPVFVLRDTLELTVKVGKLIGLNQIWPLGFHSVCKSELSNIIKGKIQNDILFGYKDLKVKCNTYFRNFKGNRIPPLHSTLTIFT